MHRKRTKLTRSPHCGQYLMLFDAVSLTKKAEPPPTRDVNRDSGTASANGGWLRRLVRRRHFDTSLVFMLNDTSPFFALNVIFVTGTLVPFMVTAPKYHV